MKIGLWHVPLMHDKVPHIEGGRGPMPTKKASMNRAHVHRILKCLMLK